MSSRRRAASLAIRSWIPRSGRWRWTESAGRSAPAEPCCSRVMFGTIRCARPPPKASPLTNALNAVRRPAIAIDRFAFVLDANPAMDCVFDDCIHVRNRRLFVADVEAKTCLERLTDRLRTTSDTDVLPCEPIVVRRKRRAPVVIRVLPVHGAARSPFLGARALLTFASVEPRPGPKSSLLAKLFGLTPAEAKLASLMAEGISVEKAAEALEISRETARNQLKAVFAKTATHRQSELVALLSGL
jgi:DNA-binding CsgD family transcriptional regulator